ncbi:L-fuculose-phosphate aldolase [Alteromonadaceae bacterium Bs31]|nr:L-fuculose-phosphate aldolase [Alteromonadaceae bacterium Bs31]
MKEIKPESRDQKFKYLHPADQIVMIMERIYRYEMTTTSGGNLSVRDEDGGIWITPAGVDKGSLTRKDIVYIRKDGEHEGEHRPSSEYPFHLAIYEARPDIDAVLHAHPPALVSFSAAGKTPDLHMLPNTRHICEAVDFVPYGLPGSTDLGSKIASSFGAGFNTVLLENHGVVTASQNLFEAFKQFETLDYSARIQVKAQVLGGYKCISAEQMTIYDQKCNDLPEFISEAPVSKEKAIRREMVHMMRRSYDQGLITSTDGTFAVRLDKDSFLISPYGYDRKYLCEADIVLVKNGHRQAGKYPSRSSRLVLELFQAHDEVNAFILAHAPNVMAFNVSGKELNSRIIPEAYILLRDITILPIESLTQDHLRIVNQLSASQPLAMIQNNGILVTGENLLQAFDRLEVAEFTAKAILGAHQLGCVKVMNDEVIEELVTAFKLP